MPFHLRLLIRHLFFLLLTASAIASSFAANPGNAPATTSPSFKVAIADYPPYAYKNTENKWVGVSVDLWEQIARKLGYNYEYVELPQTEILEALHHGNCDLSVSEITPTLETERLVDFTQPYLASRLAVAFNNFILLQEIRNFLYVLMNNGVFEIFLAMMGALVIFSFFIWLAERKKNEHFGGYFPCAVGSALWFGAVTMTSIGYGDKIPLTFLGRSVTFVWMITGMLLVALLTGTVVSSIATASDHQSVKHINDLSHYKNGVINDGYATQTLRSKGIHAKKFASFEEGLKALSEKKISAFVGDSISLQYLVARDYPSHLRLATLPSGTIYRMLALRPNFPYKEPINLALLEITTPLEWNTEIEKWTGPLILGH
ncbi:MAG TPA: transporter substrate-binding domain-containing protein [Chthoniobacterales bacterium]|nr:transporter substrate-binding domain-containing protein [Chthoniobacterales bacterium]